MTSALRFSNSRRNNRQLRHITRTDELIAQSAVSSVEKIARENTNRMAYESRFKETTTFATELIIVSAFVVFLFVSLWNPRDIGRLQDVL